MPDARTGDNIGYLTFGTNKFFIRISNKLNFAWFLF